MGGSSVALCFISLSIIFPRQNLRETTSNSHKNGQKKSGLNEKSIALLAQLHDQLCDIVDIFNKFFLFMLVCNLSVVLFLNIVSYFGLYRILITQVPREFIGIAIFGLNWNNFFTILVSVFVVMSSMVTKSGNETVAVLHKTLRGVEDSFTKKRVRIEKPKNLVCFNLKFSQSTDSHICAANQT